jgi:hypothetical protein
MSKLIIKCGTDKPLCNLEVDSLPRIGEKLIIPSKEFNGQRVRYIVEDVIHIAYDGRVVDIMVQLKLF